MSTVMWKRRSFILGAACLAVSGGRLFAETPLRLPLVEGRQTFVAWTRFCQENSWAGGDASAELHSIGDWRGIAERVDAEVDKAPFLLGRSFPRVIPRAGEATNCVGSALRKMALLILHHGFPSGDARLLYLTRLGPDQKDHAALVLRFQEGDFVLDSEAPESRPGLHHWTRLARRPVLISEGRESYRAIDTRGIWRPQLGEV